MYDTRLVIAAQEGDEAAFAALFDRNVDAVYDLCWALTGDESEASRLTADAFRLAARHLDEISDASQVRPWLLAIARDRALADDEAGLLRMGWGSRLPADSGDEPLGSGELRRWVREAAATLALADQAVVELTARHDIDGDQLAAAIGCEPERLAGVLAEVDREAQEVLGALVVARQGRRDCAELAELLRRWDGTPSVETAEVAAAHADRCERCDRRRALADPLRMLADAPAALPPPDLRTSVLDRVAPEMAAAARRSRGSASDRASTSSAALGAAAVVSAVGTASDAAAVGTPLAAGSPPLASGSAPVASGAPPAAASGAPVSAASPTVAIPIGPPYDAGGPGGSASQWSGPAPFTPAGSAALPPLPPAIAGTGEKGPDGPPWPIIVAAGIAAVVLVVIVALAVRPSHKGSTVNSGAASTLAPGTVVPPPTTTPLAAQTLAPIDTSTTSTSTTAAPAGRLELNTTSVDLGAAATSAQVLLTNSGAAATGWTASTSAPWLAASPGSGTLAPRASATLTLVIDRSHAPGGPFNVRVTLSATGAGGVGTSVAVTGSNTVATTTTPSTSTTSTTAPPGPQIADVTPEQGVCQVKVSATVTDTQSVSSVVVSYTLPDGKRGTAGMSQSGGSWSATVTGWKAGGTLTYSVTATDAAGRTATSSSHSVTVATCP